MTYPSDFDPGTSDPRDPDLLGHSLEILRDVANLEEDE